MISREPVLSVGLVEHAKEVSGIFNGSYELPNSIRISGSFRVLNDGRALVLYDDENIEVLRIADLYFRSLNGATCTLCDVKIGINFHWERTESQTFEGDVRILAAPDGTMSVINTIGVERYLTSVISSEMHPEAPYELLKAHAITSRSWLLAMLERQKKSRDLGPGSPRQYESDTEFIRWYDREDHTLFDVCADDHCQRYQGITKVVPASADQALTATRGMFLVSGNEICDARFSKACGGRTELFEYCWDDTPHPYLQSISDSVETHPHILNEVDAERWILSSPHAYCNTTDGMILKQILPLFDRETTDFFRWTVEYSRQQLEELLQSTSGIDFGIVTDVVPLQRGSSGRISRIKIIGSKRTLIVGKELEIRRWFSKTHLYSSAFIVKKEYDGENVPVKFILHGAGWGHGVGLCQIGAAVMAVQGMKAEEILKHYFHGSELQKLY